MANQEPTIPVQPDIEKIVNKSLKMHFNTYEEYVDYAKDVNEEVLSLIDWTRETQERSIENQGAFYTRLLKNSIGLTEEVKKKFSKEIVGSLKSIATGITSAKKDSVPRSPTLSSISGRSTSGFGSLVTGIRTAFQKEDVKFLLKNDPDFQGASIKEVKAILKQREKSTKELAALEAKQEKLISLGGFNEQIQEKIDELKDFLGSGKKKAAEYEAGKVPVTGQTAPAVSGERKRGRPTNQSYIEASTSSWMATLDKSNVAIVTNLIKLDNRLASIEGLVTKLVRTDRAESQRLEEAGEEAPKTEATKEKKPTEALKQAEEVKEKAEESKGIVGQIVDLMGKGDTGVIGTLLGIKKVFSFFPIIAPALIGITTILISKKFVDAIGEMSLFGSGGEKTDAGKFIEEANKLAGGQGLKPESEKSRVEKIKGDADTGWWDFGDKKKERYKQQYLSEIQRGGEFSKEEAAALKEEFDINVPEKNIIARSEKQTSLLANDRSKQQMLKEPIKEEAKKSPADFRQPNPMLKFGKVAATVDLKTAEASMPVQDNVVPNIYPTPRNFGEKLETEQKQLERAEQRSMAMNQTTPSASVVVAPSTSNTFNNTTAVGIRTTPRHAERTFERAVGNRYSFDW